MARRGGAPSLRHRRGGAGPVADSGGAGPSTRLILRRALGSFPRPRGARRAGERGDRALAPFPRCAGLLLRARGPQPVVTAAVRAGLAAPGAARVSVRPLVGSRKLAERAPRPSYESLLSACGGSLLGVRRRGVETAFLLG